MVLQAKVKIGNKRVLKKVVNDINENKRLKINPRFLLVQIRQISIKYFGKRKQIKLKMPQMLLKKVYKFTKMSDKIIIYDNTNLPV